MLMLGKAGRHGLTVSKQRHRPAPSVDVHIGRGPVGIEHAGGPGGHTKNVLGRQGPVGVEHDVVVAAEFDQEMVLHGYFLVWC